MVYLTRRYRFAASHRLHNDAFSAQENMRIYGKCNNPYGHGHNYVLDVTLAGEVDPDTGQIYDLAALDQTVGREVIERFDHIHLNLDVENFRTQVPTTENLCVEIYKLLSPRLRGEGRFASAQLDSIRLEETNSNFFEYSGGSEGRKAR
jgi:6-pyruvoyltetrahydropterin/6-carboxytetrahydropterin synthase